MFRLVYTVDGEFRERLNSPKQFNAILFLSSLLPYPEFNSIAQFSAMKSEAETGEKAHRFWLDGGNCEHVITMEIA